MVTRVRFRHHARVRPEHGAGGILEQRVRRVAGVGAEVVRGADVEVSGVHEMNDPLRAVDAAVSAPASMVPDAAKSRNAIATSFFAANARL